MIALVLNLRLHGPFESLWVSEWFSKVRISILSSVKVRHTLNTPYSGVCVCVCMSDICSSLRRVGLIPAEVRPRWRQRLDVASGLQNPGSSSSWQRKSFLWTTLREGGGDESREEECHKLWYPERGLAGFRPPLYPCKHRYQEWNEEEVSTLLVIQSPIQGNCRFEMKAQESCLVGQVLTPQLSKSISGDIIEGQGKVC